MSDPFDDRIDDAPEGEVLPAAKPARKRSPYRAQMIRSNAALAVMLLAAAAGIYAFSLRKGPATASAAQKAVETQIDTAILRITQQASSQPGAPQPGRVTRDLLQTFYDQVRDKQIPLAELSKNPFVFVRPLREETEEPAQPAPTTASAPALAPLPGQSLPEVQAAFRSLRLQSIMMGQSSSGGTAIISNNLLTEGQRIECFTIKSIQPKAVVLSWEDKEFVLRMP